MRVTSASRERKILNSLRLSRTHCKLTCWRHETRLVKGQYRGEEANLYYNLRTQNVVVTDLANNVMAAFKTSPAQARYVNTTARLN